ncbi:MAG: 1-aminocyclopropane-1-carboxylate deaminase/D-cysteine desulfhydrase, partial [Bacteroidetes bacterium]|nr:1-aminocyclopropane-1-carboxylate deaminase/D-cysteine desulfhydrase [Bacteroidota bacterium]
MEKAEIQNLEEFQKKKYDTLLTFGGAYSNLIVAAAAAGKESGIKTIGVIRGEEHHPDSNPVLRFATECGMKLIFVSRKKYRSYREHPDLAAAEFQFPCSRLYVLPEGGSNELAVAGCREICDDI